MKHFTKIMLAMTVLFGLYACSSDDDNPSENTVETLTELHKKWDIQSTSPVGSASQLTSFDVDLNAIESIEFSDEGIFVIVETNAEVTTGTYTIDAATSVLTLENLGTITINELNASSLDFTFELSNETLNLIAQPAPEIPTNAANELMFRLWTVQNLNTLNQGITIPEEIVVRIEVLFTPYGTYLVEQEFQDGSIEFENNFWKWRNEAQTEACFKSEEEEEFDCDEDFFRIVSLSASEFRLLDLPDTEDENEFILVPAN